MGIIVNVHSQGIARSPTPKKKLKRNNITVATIPEAWLPSQTVPARIAIQQPWPITANIINLRRPSLVLLVEFPSEGDSRVPTDQWPRLEPMQRKSMQHH